MSKKLLYSSWLFVYLTLVPFVCGSDCKYSLYKRFRLLSTLLILFGFCVAENFVPRRRMIWKIFVSRLPYLQPLGLLVDVAIVASCFQRNSKIGFSNFIERACRKKSNDEKLRQLQRIFARSQTKFITTRKPLILLLWRYETWELSFTFSRTMDSSSLPSAWRLEALYVIIDFHLLFLFAFFLSYTECTGI